MVPGATAQSTKIDLWLVRGTQSEGTILLDRSTIPQSYSPNTKKRQPAVSAQTNIRPFAGLFFDENYIKEWTLSSLRLVHRNSRVDSRARLATIRAEYFATTKARPMGQAYACMSPYRAPVPCY